MRPKMNEAKCDKASRKHTIMTVLGIASMMLLMLVNIAGAAQSSNAWVQEGRMLTNSGKYNEAITAYDKAIEINPQNSLAWNGKGIVLDELGKFDEAIKAYNKAIEIDPQYFEAWTNNGVDLVNLNKFDEAKASYENEIKINPSWEGKRN